MEFTRDQQAEINVAVDCLKSFRADSVSVINESDENSIAVTVIGLFDDGQNTKKTDGFFGIWNSSGFQWRVYIEGNES